MCGAPLGLGESIGIFGATLSHLSTSVSSIWIHLCVSLAQSLRYVPSLQVIWLAEPAFNSANLVSFALIRIFDGQSGPPAAAGALVTDPFAPPSSAGQRGTTQVAR